MCNHRWSSFSPKKENYTYRILRLISRTVSTISYQVVGSLRLSIKLVVSHSHVRLRIPF